MCVVTDANPLPSIKKSLFDNSSGFCCIRLSHTCSVTPQREFLKLQFKDGPKSKMKNLNCIVF